MCYVDPKKVLSPRGVVKDLEVILDTGEWGFSVAKLTWEGQENHYGVRWNGGTTKNKGVTKGSPVSSGHAVWFLIPEKLVKSIDFDRLIQKEQYELICDKVINAVEDQKKLDPTKFSITVKSQLKIDKETLEQVKDALKASGVILISINETPDGAELNVAYPN